MRIRALKFLLLNAALMTCCGIAQATELPQAAAPAETFRLAAGKLGQLDMGDERPVGENQIMRGKKYSFYEGHPTYKSRKNEWVDTAILITLAALMALIVYVFVASRRPAR